MLKKEESSPEFYSPRSLVRTNLSLDASSHFSPASFSSCHSSPPSQQQSMCFPDPELGTRTHLSSSFSPSLVSPGLSHINTSPGVLLIDPSMGPASSSPLPFSPIASSTKSKSKRKVKKNTADSCIRRLCASHQTDIGLLCDLWSAPSTPSAANSTVNSFNPSSFHQSPSTEFSSVNNNSLRASPSSSLEPVVVHTGENERQRLLQAEMQLMRMQLQQAELLLPPSRASSTPLVGLSRNSSAVPNEDTTKKSLSASPSSCSLAESENMEGPRKLVLRLGEDPTLSIHIAQEEHQNLLLAEADYRASKRTSKPATPSNCTPDHSDLRSASSQTGEFTNTPLCQGYLKMPRGVLCKFLGTKKRFCLLDSARCFFYWKSQEHREAGRAKCFSGVTGGTLVSGDDKSLELSYAGGVILLRCESAEEAQRWLLALTTLDEPQTERLEADQGGSLSHQSSVPSSCQASPELIAQPEAVRRPQDMRREVIQNAFLDEFRKEQQFEQLLRASKNNLPSPCAREPFAPSLVF